MDNDLLTDIKKKLDENSDRHASFEQKIDKITTYFTGDEISKTKGIFERLEDTEEKADYAHNFSKTANKKIKWTIRAVWGAITTTAAYIFFGD